MSDTVVIEGEVNLLSQVDGDPAVVLANIPIADGSITEAKLSDSLKLKTINEYVTPEMYGAKGDGVTDDTEAVQQAINSGLHVIGKGVYKITETQGSYYPITISNDGVKIIGNFIDGRTFSTTSNRKNLGVFLVNADDVEIDIKITNPNELPIDDEDANNLSDVGGYAVTLGYDVNNVCVKVKCSHLNGVNSRGLFYNSKIEVDAYFSAYPYAGLCAVNSQIRINANKCHRAWWGACNKCDVVIKAKDYYSKGSSSHVLVCAVKIDDVIYHCNHSSFLIIDTGTTDTPNNASYFDFYNDVGGASEVFADATIMGDVSATQDGVYNIHTSQTGSVITGRLTIHNQLKTNTTYGASRIMSGVNVIEYDSEYTQIIVNTASKISININGVDVLGGKVTITTIGANSTVSISDFGAITVQNPISFSTYDLFVVKNVRTFNKTNVQRLSVCDFTKYMGETVVQ